MLSNLWHKNSAFRIFSISGLFTVLALIVVFVAAGPVAFLIALALITIEVTFSFDNAVINAKVLQTLSPFWQRIFLTVGIAIAVFGMRIIFPIAIVAITTALQWREVIDLSLNNPGKYEQALGQAEPSIAAFGGAFLLMLSLHFFMNPSKHIHWWKSLEKHLARVPNRWIYATVASTVLMFVAALPANPHPVETIKAGIVGVMVYLALHGLAEHFLPKWHYRRVARTGVAGFVGFLYLEALDASFSLDGVIGAFALTNKVLLIAVGLGVGAIWVRSLTVYLTRSQTLKVYRYLEHGAHYAIAVLSASMLTSLLFDIPQVATGLISIGIIGASLIASRKANKESVREIPV